MRTRLIAVLIALTLQAAESGGPSYLYVVTTGWSDFMPSVSYGIIEVWKDGNDSIIRSSEVATLPFCSRVVVRSKETRVNNQTPAQIIGSSNPCAISPKKMRSGLHVTQYSSGFGSTYLGVVAECGSLSTDRTADLSQLKELASRLKKHTGDFAKADELSLQQAGEKLIPHLLSGRYDVGLAASLQTTVAKVRQIFPSMIGSYQGPTANVQPDVLVVHPRGLDLRPPVYPPLAQVVRVQGRVELQLTLDHESGRVLKTSAIAAHPLLTRASTDAAAAWTFPPGQDSVNVVLDFVLCH